MVWVSTILFLGTLHQESGINEDHATGSAHCMLVPFWSKKLGKSNLISLQTSPRGGEFYCENKEKIVSLRGHADQFLEGELTI